jgi:DNA adenine methylase
MIRYDSPLRYPGGKSCLANYFKAILKQNDLLGCEYVEPYAGGSSVALALLFGGYVSTVHINDLSRPVAAFWRSALTQTDELCRRIRDCRVTVDNYARQKAILSKPQKVSTLQLGFAAFFVNRTSRSGIISSRSGVIGGKDQKGKWKVDARFGRRGLVERIEAIGKRRKDIRLYNMDAADFLREHVTSLPSRTFIYLDPPYYRNGQRLYQNFYRHPDHVSLARIVLRLKQQWALSYDDAPEVRSLYQDRGGLTYSIPYSAASRYTGCEVLFFSAGLRVPSVAEPARFTDAGFRDWIRQRLTATTG